MDESMVSKEVNAVNSEYEIGLSSDGWKFIHMLNLLSSKDHPLNKFSTGNLGTLNKENIVETLKEFHRKHYSSNLMSLVIKSSTSLKDMEALIRSSDFNIIPNKNLPKINYAKLGYPLPFPTSIIKYQIN
jgi:insulysin